MAEAAAQPGRRRWLLFGVPLALFLLVAVFLGIGLTRDPSTLPSALVGKPAPDFTLPPLEGRDQHGFSRADLGGRPMLINVFASWCTACRLEHPVFMRLKAEGVVPIHGINYKDRPDDAAAWLDELGDPYTRTGADRDGRVAIDWGVYGVPETFIVDRDGRVAFKQVGPITPEVYAGTIAPVLERLRR